MHATFCGWRAALRDSIIMMMMSLCGSPTTPPRAVHSLCERTLEKYASPSSVGGRWLGRSTPYTDKSQSLYATYIPIHVDFAYYTMWRTDYYIISTPRAAERDNCVPSLPGPTVAVESSEHSRPASLPAGGCRSSTSQSFPAVRVQTSLPLPASTRMSVASRHLVREGPM